MSLYSLFKGLALLILSLLLKRTDLISSSSKRMVSLLSTIQSHIRLFFFSKLDFKFFKIIVLKI